MAEIFDVEIFISRWTTGSGGQERANYRLFLSELCDLIGVDCQSCTALPATEEALAIL